MYTVIISASVLFGVHFPQRPIRPPVRSNSAPSVVPSLYLLGTFEVNFVFKA